MIDRRKLIQLLSGKIKTQYLLRDYFLTNQSAPLAGTRTCEPGPGSLSIVDTGNFLSISSSALLSSNNTAQGNPRVYSPSITRFSGRSFGWKTTPISGAATHFLGYRADTTATPNVYAVILPTGTIIDNATNITSTEVFLNGQTYTFAIVYRSIGAFYFVKGGSFTEWTLIWVSFLSNSNLFAGFGASAITPASYSVSKLTEADSPSPLNTDYGIAKDYYPTPTNGQVGNASKDGLVNLSWTPVAGETLDIFIRRTDDNNCWIIRCSQTGSTIKIIEKVLGVETERSSAAVTFTAGVLRSIAIKYNLSAIRTYTNNTIRNTYTSAIFNQSVEGMKVSGFSSMVNLVSWERVLTNSSSLNWLNSFIS